MYKIYVIFLLLGFTSFYGQNNLKSYNFYDTIFNQEGIVMSSLLKNPYGLTLEINKYDQKGNIIEFTEYDEGILDYRILFKYADNIREIEKYEYNSLDSLTSKTVSKYNKTGTKGKIIKYDSKNNVITTSKEKYNKKSLLIKSASYNSKNQKIGKASLKYDKKGNRIEYIDYGFGYSNFKNKHLYNYDNNYNLSEILISDSKGIITFKESRQYDENNVIERISQYRKVGDINEFDFYYDEDGELFKTILMKSDENQKVKFLYEYDEKGNKVKESKYGFDDRLIRMNTEKFDKNGNKIEEANFLGEEVNLVDRINYEYDMEVRLVETLTYNKDNKLEIKTIFKYSEIGDSAKGFIYDNKGNLIDTF
jgi:hypothetical protein